MRGIRQYEKLLILLIIFLIPIDYFGPTADIFREAGAKPFNLFVLFSFIIYFYFSGLHAQKNNQSNINPSLFFILFLGSVSFIFNLLFFDKSSGNRTPEFQFFSQFLMFLLFILVFNALRLIFLNSYLRLFVLNIIPLVVFFHLIIFAFEFFEILNSSNPEFLIYFRNSAGLIDRASGLMSEPSYFGTFSGLFVLPLILLYKKHRILNALISILLVIFSVLIQAKTFFIVILFQILFIFFGMKYSGKTKLIIGCIAIHLVAIAIYVMNTSLVFDVEQNLSSAMRLGSNILALNVFTSGYGFLGIGFGQFHFYYLPEFSPNFLLNSREALEQMNHINDTRASTFSLPIRLLVETGIFGFLSFIIILCLVFKRFSGSKDLATQMGLLLTSGSIGFLLTQDTYCLPSLALGLALILTQPDDKVNYLPEK